MYTDFLLYSLPPFCCAYTLCCCVHSNQTAVPYYFQNLTIKNVLAGSNCNFSESICHQPFAEKSNCNLNLATLSYTEMEDAICLEWAWSMTLHYRKWVSRWCSPSSGGPAVRISKTGTWNKPLTSDQTLHLFYAQRHQTLNIEIISAIASSNKILVS